MAKVNFKRVTTDNDVSKIPIEDGNFIVTKQGKTYVDFDSSRIPTSGTPDIEMSDTSTNTVENKVIKKYVDNNIQIIRESCDFTIETDGNWTIKKYENGYCEMYHNFLGTFNINGEYLPSLVRWAQTPTYQYPIPLTKLISANASVGGAGHLIGCNFSGSGIPLTGYSLYIYDFTQILNNYNVRIYTRICGMWK